MTFVGADAQAVRLAQAMQQQGFTPDEFAVTQTQYNGAFPSQGGDAVDGATAVIPHPPFSSSNAEIRLYLGWLQQASPGADPTTFGLFAWSATRLFVEKAIGLGGDLSRDSLIKAVKAEHRWDANGLHAPMDVGGKSTYNCSAIVQLDGDTWKQISPGNYFCGRLVTTSIAR